MRNELRIEIIKDSDGNYVSLDNITVEAAEALQVFLYSFTELAKTFDNPSNAKVKIENGSVEAILVYDEDEAENEETETIEDVFTNNSSDNNRINLLKKIQDKILANGLEYKVYYKDNDEIRDVTEIFEGPKFPTRRRTFQRENQIIFIKGKLYEAGGKSKANVHLENVDEGKEYKISCTKPQATNLNRRLYSEIFLSVVENKRSDNTLKYFYIDNYLNEDTYNTYKELHYDLTENEGIEKYDILYNHIIDLIHSDEESFNNLFKLIRLYDNVHTDKGIIRTVLMAIKPMISENNDLLKAYSDMAGTLRRKSKTGKI